MRFKVISALCLFACISVAHTQTYTPKEIRIEGASDSDTSEFLRIVDLHPGTDISKQQIEAALQRLGDTNLFSDISYTVGPSGLLIKVKTSAGAKPLPVRYANFVWWQPAELEKLVEARVPIFHGELPTSGTLTDQVEAALVSLLHDQKGIEAKVTALEASDRPHGPVTNIALLITNPTVQLGELHLQNANSSLQAKVDERMHTLGEEDFDAVITSFSVRENVADVYQNAGYLDVATDEPVFSAPRKVTKPHQQESYLVDATTTVHPGEIFRIANIVIPPAPPVSQSEANSASGLKVGDAASALALRVASVGISKAYGDYGYRAARITQQSSLDHAAHTASYTFAVTPGDIYHLASVNTSALTPEQQSAFSSSFHTSPGVVADSSVLRDVSKAIAAMNGGKSINVTMNVDHASRTVALILKPQPLHN
jgi:outer membrane protein assembly factor BamA